MGQCQVPAPQSARGHLLGGRSRPLAGRRVPEMCPWVLGCGHSGWIPQVRARSSRPRLREKGLETGLGLETVTLTFWRGGPGTQLRDALLTAPQTPGPLPQALLLRPPARAALGGFL